MKKPAVAGVLVFVGVVAVVLVLYFGVQLYRSIPSAAEVSGFARDTVSDLPTVPQAIDGAADMLPFGTSESVSDGEVPTTLPGATTAEADWLTPGQRAMLATFGIDEADLPKTLTPELEACFVAAVGAERVAAIKAGDTPSFGEGVRAVGCI